MLCIADRGEDTHINKGIDMARYSDTWIKKTFIPWVEDGNQSGDILIAWLSDESVLKKLRRRQADQNNLRFFGQSRELPESLIGEAIHHHYLDHNHTADYWLTFWRQKFIPKLHTALILISAQHETDNSHYLVISQLWKITKTVSQKLGISEEIFSVLVKLLDDKDVLTYHNYELLDLLVSVQIDNRLLPFWRSLLETQQFPYETYSVWKQKMQKHKSKARQLNNKLQWMNMRVLDDKQTYMNMVEETAIRGIAVLYERTCRLKGRSHTVITEIADELDVTVRRTNMHNHIFSALVQIFPPSYLGGDTMEKPGYYGMLTSCFYAGLKQYGIDHQWPMSALADIDQYCTYSSVDY